jgi:mannosyltransferase
LAHDFAGTGVLIPVIGALAVLGCLAGPGIRRGGLTLTVVALPWLVLPPALLIAVSIAHPIYVERYVVFCLRRWPS